MSNVSLIDGHIDEPKMTDDLVKKLDSADLFLRNRVKAKKSPLNEYDIEAMFDIADICNNATIEISRLKAEIERLNVELIGMHGACESYKMHYEAVIAQMQESKLKCEDVCSVYEKECFEDISANDVKDI